MTRAIQVLGAVALVVAVAVAVAGLILFRYLSIRPYKGLIRPYKAPYDVLVMALLDPRHPSPYITL